MPQAQRYLFIEAHVFFTTITLVLQTRSEQWFIESTGSNGADSIVASETVFLY